ncbi:MAG: deoxyguanosinetriphosphate triphosphohydrolase [Halanaerobiaceae bacterium]
MLKRIDIEKREEKILASKAFLSRNSKGRMKNEEKCEFRTVFQQDRDRIIHSKAFRRLKHKTQVFIVPEGDHYRTRLTHTLEVSQIARTIARALCLNEDLTEAIALGHDLGHTPFGHAGEVAINEVSNIKFSHNLHSLRVVDIIENLNLSYEVRDGIVNHTGEKEPLSLEGQIVKVADRFAYINHDIDDAIRAGIIKISDIPENIINVLGKSHSERIDIMIKDMIENSWDKDSIMRSEHIKDATENLREFLFDNVYIGSIAKKEEEKAIRLVKKLYYYYLNNPNEIIGDKIDKNENNEQYEQIVIDYIAGMTDRYAINRWKELFVPSPWAEDKTDIS